MPTICLSLSLLALSTVAYGQNQMPATQDSFPIVDPTPVCATGWGCIGNLLGTEGGVFLGSPSAQPGNGDLSVGGEIRIGSGSNYLYLSQSTINRAGTADINFGEVLNLQPDGKVLKVRGSEALWFDGTYFSWGYGGKYNRFADGIHIGGRAAPPSGGLLVDGKVGIGTSNPTYKLDVNGILRAKEIIVESGWADFVFKEGYELSSLEDVESFIRANGHLPEIPSAKQVAEQGVSLGESQTKLLQKVEELTLYLIEQNKQIKELKTELSSLRQHGNE